jgi:hypothetical protein
MKKYKIKLLLLLCRWDETMSLNCRLLTGLLFFPQMRYESGEVRWNDIDREKPEELGEKPVPVPLYPVSRVAQSV